MKATQYINEKVFSLAELTKQVTRWKLKNKSIAFTNGVFDLLHKGHISSLHEAASYADVLIVAVNSDSSVKKLKGPTRPINDEETRTLLLAELMITDAVIIFEDDTPLNLIKTLMPDVLVKGGDYTVEQIAGAKEVLENGGKVVLANIIDGISTTKTIEKMKN
jgi:D-beta-D-heptose 7-phosphate kinase/D-beta-D-heptose 1-phosphate adenosyltransferase